MDRTSLPVRADVPANLDAVRGLACLLVVALHVVGDEDSNGLHLPMTSGWHYAMVSVEFLRIPLFTALSGFLYADRRVTVEGFGRFWSKKLRRLGVPLVCITTLIWLLRSRVYGDPLPFGRALLFSFGHLWYIQALILLFGVMSVWDAMRRPGPVALGLAALAAIMLGQSGLPITRFFSLAGAIYLMPYFLFGIVLRDMPALLRHPAAGPAAFGIVVIVLAAQQLGMQGLAEPINLLMPEAALAGMAWVVVLLRRFPPNRWFAGIGRYSYTIYLWHVLFGAAARAVLIKAGISAIPALLPLIFAAALIAPIVLHILARRLPVISVIVTGDRAVRSMRPGWLPGRVAPAS
jgi:peptidoglycan/LPS O-acetylase OafA/YrhL